MPIHQNHVAARVAKCQCPTVVVEGDADAAPRTDPLAVVAIASPLTSPAVEQASHHVRPVGVAMSEPHQHVVAHLGDENEAAVGLNAVAAAAAVGRHHAYPVGVHVAHLPVHLDLNAPVAQLVVVPDDLSHLRFGHGQLNGGNGQRVRDGGDGLEPVAVIAALANHVRYLRDEELAQRRTRNAARTLEEGTLQVNHAARNQHGMLAPAHHIVRLSRVGLLFLPHVTRHLRGVMDAGKGMLPGGLLVHAHRGHEGLVAQLVLVRRRVRRLLSDGAVVERMVGEHPRRTRQGLHADVERGEARAELQPHRRGKAGGTAEDEVETVIVQPFVVLPGKPLDEAEVRLVVLAHVVQPFLVLRVHLGTHPGVPRHLLHDVRKRAVVPGVEVQVRFQQVGFRMSRNQDVPEVALRAVQADPRDDAHEGGFRLLARPHLERLANPLGPVRQIVRMQVAPDLKVEGQLKAVVVVDGLVQLERLERKEPLAVYADGDVVVDDRHVPLILPY